MPRVQHHYFSLFKQSNHLVLALSFKWTEEHDDLTHLIGDSETMPQVDPEILNIVDKGELNYWLSIFFVEVRKKKDPGNN